MTEKRKVQEHEHGRGNQRVAQTYTPPVEGEQQDRDKLYGDRQCEGDGSNRGLATEESRKRHNQQQDAEDIDVTATDHFGRKQRMPCVSQDPMGPVPGATQEIE